MLNRIALLGAIAATPVLADGPGAVQPMPAPVVAPAAAPRVADWSGSYGGVTFGAIASDGEAERGSFDGPLLSLDVQNGLFPDQIDDMDQSMVGGLTFGFNRQNGNFVSGVEMDLSLADLEVENAFSRVDPSPNPVFNGVNTNTGYDTQLSGFATARLRAGYATGNTLLFATGGVAVSDVENRFSLAIPELGYTSPDWSEDGVRYGFVVGAGVERQVSSRMRIKAEVLRYDLEDANVLAVDPVTFPGESVEYEFQNSGYVARIGVNFAF